MDTSLSVFARHCYNVSCDQIYQGSHLMHYKPENVDYLLREWRQAKGEYLFDVFGDEYILERQFNYVCDQQATVNEMNDMLREFEGFIQMLDYTMTRQMHITYSYNDRNTQFIQAVRRLTNSHSLVENRGVEEDISCTTTDCRTLSLARGQKPMRALKRVCEFFGLSEEFEQFRLAHSRVLNTKRLTGTLCLSIHPMDYATASDNANGWESCMSWINEGGYRAGTLEMMNSPMVICAYLKSEKNEFNYADVEWNSKKWRAWIIVNRDCILCNRNYPYDSTVLSTEAIQWVAQLVHDKLGWTYGPISRFGYDHRMNFTTNMMYNDISTDELVCYGPHIAVQSLNSYWDQRPTCNFSGRATCINCGEVFENYGDEGTLMCEDCHGRERCCACGDYVDCDNTYRDENGDVYCEYCYHERYGHCELCENEYAYDDMVTLGVYVDADKMREIFTNLPQDSDMRKAWTHKNYWSGREELETPSCVTQNCCPDCIADLGINLDEDCCYRNYSYAGFVHWLNPDKVPFKVAARILGLSNDPWADDTQAPGWKLAYESSNPSEIHSY